MKLKARMGASVSVVKVALLSVPAWWRILPMKRPSFSGVRPAAAGRRTPEDETRASPLTFPGRVGVEGAADDEAHFPHSS